LVFPQTPIPHSPAKGVALDAQFIGHRRLAHSLIKQLLSSFQHLCAQHPATADFASGPKSSRKAEGVDATTTVITHCAVNRAFGNAKGFDDLAGAAATCFNQLGAYKAKQPMLTNGVLVHGM
jgi:hypothetical protein